MFSSNKFQLFLHVWCIYVALFRSPYIFMFVQQLCALGKGTICTKASSFDLVKTVVSKWSKLATQLDRIRSTFTGFALPGTSTIMYALIYIGKCHAHTFLAHSLFRALILALCYFSSYFILDLFHTFVTYGKLVLLRTLYIYIYVCLPLKPSRWWNGYLIVWHCNKMRLAEYAFVCMWF